MRQRLSGTHSAGPPHPSTTENRCKNLRNQGMFRLSEGFPSRRVVLIRIMRHLPPYLPNSKGQSTQACHQQCQSNAAKSPANSHLPISLSVTLDNFTDKHVIVIQTSYSRIRQPVALTLIPINLLHIRSFPRIWPVLTLAAC